MDDDAAATFTVIDVPERARFELHRDGERVGLADYHVTGDVLVIPHVETAVVHRDKGFAARLMAGIVDDVRRRGLRIRPVCPYAAAYLADHPGDADVVAGG